MYLVVGDDLSLPRSSFTHYEISGVGSRFAVVGGMVGAKRVDCDVGTASLCEAAPGPAKSQKEQGAAVGRTTGGEPGRGVGTDAGFRAQWAVSVDQDSLMRVEGTGEDRMAGGVEKDRRCDEAEKSPFERVAIPAPPIPAPTTQAPVITILHRCHNDHRTENQGTAFPSATHAHCLVLTCFQTKGNRR